VSGAVTGAPKMLLRLEGLFVLVAASAAFVRLGTSWWLFAALFLAPDLRPWVRSRIRRQLRRQPSGPDG
jgi:Domain of unknown function (DUF4260)